MSLSPTTATTKPPSQQIKIIQLIPVLEDIAFHLAAIDPGDEILHVAGDEEGGVGDDFGSHADVALFDEFDGLQDGCDIVSKRVAGILSRPPLDWSMCRDGCGRGANLLTPVIVSLILNLVITTPNLRLHILLTPTLRSTSLNLTPSLKIPMSYNFSSSSFSCFRRTGSVGSRVDSAWARDFRAPQSRLYLV